MRKILVLALVAIITILGSCNKNPTNSGSEVTRIVGATYNSAYIKDSSTFFFVDNNNKTWTVDYRSSSFSKFSSSYGRVQGTDERLNTTLLEWLKGQQHIFDPEEGPGGTPGTTTITGILNVDGIFVASSIRVDGQ